MQIHFFYECSKCGRQAREIRDDVRIWERINVKLPMGWFIKQAEGKELYFCPQCMSEHSDAKEGYKK